MYVLLNTAPAAQENVKNCFGARVTNLATQALVLMLNDAMVPVKRGVVSNCHTFMLAQASHVCSPFEPSPL